MTLRIRYSDPQGIDEPTVTVSLGSNARWGDVAIANSAELGEGATCTVAFEDPGGVYDFVGLRAMDFSETSAPSNNQIIGRYAIQNRKVRRDADRALITGADRLWEIDLVDYNWHLGSRIHVDADANRPAETAGDRIRWLLSAAAHIKLYDYGHVSYPSNQLDAADFRGQRPTDLLSDALVEVGYNFWVDYNEAHGRPELFVINPDSSTYQSMLQISNLIADEDGVTTFFPWMDATLERSPSRIAYGVYVAYAKGAVYVRNDIVGEQFAHIDQAAPMANVKTAARARRIGEKFLADNDEESDRIVVTIKVPRAQVNDVRHGQSLLVKFQHLPGYEDWTSMRVLRRAVVQEEQGGDDYYKIVLEMVPGGTTPVGSVFAALLQANYGSDFSPAKSFETTGDNPIAGWYPEPTAGSFSFAESSAPYYTIVVEEDMTVRIEAAIWAAAVAGPTRTMSVRVNGSIVGSSSYAPGGGYWNNWFQVDIPTIDVFAGDEITMDCYGGDGWGGFTVNTTYLRVGRGTQSWNSDSVTWEGPS